MVEKDKGEKKTDDKPDILKEDTYSHCSIHNVPYPRGASCPKCAQDSQND